MSIGLSPIDFSILHLLRPGCHSRESTPGAIFLEKIGAGGRGVVYRARDERLEREVTLKVLPAGILADETARKRFRKETLALSQINHPNIATVAVLRQGPFSAIERLLPDCALWLRAVVLEELYAGARGTGRQVVEELENAFVGQDRLLAPDLGDWTRTGLALAEVAERFGYEEIGRSRLTNDVLIAAGAARRRLVLLTSSRRDFERLAEVIPFQWRVVQP